jgi:hypothetical protein
MGLRPSFIRLLVVKQARADLAGRKSMRPGSCTSFSAVILSIEGYLTI